MAARPGLREVEADIRRALSYPRADLDLVVRAEVIRGALCTQPISVLHNLGGVGSGEEVNRPVHEHPRPVQIVAQFVEVDTFPDEGSQ